MKNKILSVIALLVVVCMLLPSCAGDGSPADTTVPETTEKIEETTGDEAEETTGTETEADTESVDSTNTDTTAEETTAPDTTVKDAETSAPTVDTTTQIQHTPQTEPVETTPVSKETEQSGGGSVSIGDIDIGTQPGTQTGTTETKAPDKETQAPTPETQPPKEEVVPEGYFKTASGKILAHTVSDRSVNNTDDNSTTLSFMPMKSTTAKTNPSADYNRAKVDLATLRPGAMSQGVLLGYDDYMFYKDTLNDFKGQGVLADTIYDRTVESLKKRNDWAEAHGKKFYFVIAPNKNTVYSDYMPEGYQIAAYRRYDQFVELIEDAGITAVDLRGAMSEAVKNNPKENLYYKYDTHWNNHGGYVAYRATMDLIDEDFPNVVIHDRSEYQINYAETYMKDLAWYLGVYDKVKDYGPVYTLKSGKTAKLTFYQEKQGWGQFQFAHINEDGYSDKLYYYQYTNEYNKDAPNIYIMRDSYSIAMVPFLKDSFYKSTYNWTFEFSESAIERAEADIIMVIVAERNLRNYVNNKAVND